MTAKDEVKLTIQKIYLKDVSFESPQSPEIFRSQWQPTVKLDLSTKNKKLSEDFYEVSLSLLVSMDHEEKPAVVIEVDQAGVFQVQTESPDQLKRVLGVFCPGTLFPYAREAVDHLLLKGGLPPLMLAPVNFEGLYEQAAIKANEGPVSL